MFCKKGFIRNFTKFTGKHLCQSLFKLGCSNFIKKRDWHRYFPVNFAQFLRTPFFIEHFWWLLLSKVNHLYETVGHNFLVRIFLRYSVSLRIQSECGKIRTRITPNTNTFYTVFLSIMKNGFDVIAV